jgi:hypothetical protein
MAATPGGDASAALRFFAQESALFHAHVQAAMAKFEAGGDPPASLFKARDIARLEKGARRRRKGAEGGAKRAPSVFNLFVKDNLARLKAKYAKKGGEAPKVTDMMRETGAAWKALSEEAKRQLAAKYAPAIAAAGGDAAAAAARAAAPGAPAASSSESDSDSD